MRVPPLEHLDVSGMAGARSAKGGMRFVFVGRTHPDNTLAAMDRVTEQFTRELLGPGSCPKGSLIF